MWYQAWGPDPAEPFPVLGAAEHLRVVFVQVEHWAAALKRERASAAEAADSWEVRRAGAYIADIDSYKVVYTLMPGDMHIKDFEPELNFGALHTLWVQRFGY